MENVANINKKPANKKPTKSKKKSWHEVETLIKYYSYADFMRGFRDPKLKDYPECRELLATPFPKAAMFFGTDDRSVPALINENYEIKLKSISWLHAEVQNYFYNLKDEKFRLHEKDIKYISNIFMNNPRRVDFKDIKNVCQFSESQEKVICWKTLDFDFLSNPAETPYIDEIMARWENSKEFMKFVGMLFYSDARYDFQKYIWVVGEEGSGKGTIDRMLRNVLGSASLTIQSDSFDSKFGMACCVGKRLLSFDDAIDDQFIKKGNLMSHTGGGELKIEDKYEKSYRLKLSFLPIIYSNKEPKITGGEHVRRLIFVKAKRAAENKDPLTYQEKVNNEARDWISKCVNMFLSSLPNAFKEYDSFSEDLLGENLDYCHEVINDHLVITNNENDKMFKGELELILRTNKVSEADIALILRILKENYKLKYGKLKIDKLSRYGFRGVRTKGF